MRDRSGALRNTWRRRQPWSIGLSRRRGADRAEAELLRRTANRLRADPATPGVTGLGEDVVALAALLELLAAELPHVDPSLRRDVVTSCRVALDE